MKKRKNSMKRNIPHTRDLDFRTGYRSQEDYNNGYTNDHVTDQNCINLPLNNVTNNFILHYFSSITRYNR